MSRSRSNILHCCVRESFVDFLLRFAIYEICRTRNLVVFERENVLQNADSLSSYKKKETTGCEFNIENISGITFSFEWGQSVHDKICRDVRFLILRTDTGAGVAPVLSISKGSLN